ncbi:IS110 family transposase [Rhodococcus sp. NM-2]|uniref:IS110 family transposase n=1 Tax=Rhodococcus sp. NM-2 TaxID=3401174 RepID=UPI003AAD736A
MGTDYESKISVYGGIDTHKDTHHVAVIDEHGRPLGDREFGATGAGYRKVIDHLRGFGVVVAVAVEGTGSYGAELARILRRAGMTVLEVARPDRRARVCTVSPTRSTRSRRPSLHCPGAGWRPRKTATGWSNRCGSCPPNSPRLARREARR